MTSVGETEAEGAEVGRDLAEGDSVPLGIRLGVGVPIKPANKDFCAGEGDGATATVVVPAGPLDWLCPAVIALSVPSTSTKVAAAAMARMGLLIRLDFAWLTFLWDSVNKI
jgi:hypothetical protein